MSQPSRLAYIDRMLLSLLRTGWPQWRLRRRRDGAVSA